MGVRDEVNTGLAIIFMPPIDPCAQRLASQQLIEQRLTKASEIVSLLGAVQAQDYAMSKWALGQRLRGATDAAIETEINDGAILRTHVLRPTWHYVAPADIRWMLSLTGPRVKAILASYDRQLGIDAAVVRRSQKVMAKALKGGKHLTRAELSDAMEKAGIRTDGTERRSRLVMHAELDALLCSGARRGKQTTYALLEERVPPAKTIERDAALHALASRYFATRGPATVADFAWWSGLTMADARSAIHDLGSMVDEVEIAGRKHWFSGRSTMKVKSPLARLLPNYDEYFIGLKDRSAIHNTLKESGVDASLDALSGHLVTIDGQIVGGWRQAFKRESVIIRMKPHITLSRIQQRAVQSEVARFSAFVGVPAQLEVTP